MEDKKITEEVTEAAENTAAEAAENAAEEVAEVTETAAEVTEAAEETAAELKEDVEEAVEEVAEVSDEIVETIEESETETGAAAEYVRAEGVEVLEDIAVAGGALEEAAIEQEKAEEAAVDAAVEKAEVTADTVKSVAPVKEPPIIKKKRKLDKTNVIVIVVCAVIVLACLAFVAIKLGWFQGKPKPKQTVEDYSTIEVLKTDVEVTDDAIQQYITSILQSQSVTNEVTEGVVADGDTLNIDYVGKLASTGEVFEGGSAQGQSLTIGSGTMIDGFESGLIGAQIGTTKTIEVTFPEEYPNKPELAGQPATFDVTINSKSVTVVPELTDEFVAEYSKNYMEKQLNTTAELEAYAKDYLYNYYLHNAMFKELQKKQTVTSYDLEKEEMLKKYSKDSLEYYAAMYGTSADEYAVMYGYTDAEAYTVEEAHYYLNTIMLIDKILDDKNITWTDEQFDQALALYMARNGYSEKYTLDEFKETSGETWLYLYENLEFKFDLAMEALEPNVVFVDQKSDAEEASEPVSGAETPEAESGSEAAGN